MSSIERRKHFRSELAGAQQIAVATAQRERIPYRILRVRLVRAIWRCIRNYVINRAQKTLPIGISRCPANCCRNRAERKDSISHSEGPAGPGDLALHQELCHQSSAENTSDRN